MRNLQRFAALVLCAALVMALGGCADRGGDFSLGAAVGEAPQTLDPIYAQRVSEQTIIAHLYENLMKLNVDADGQLIVRTDSGEEKVFTGEVSVHGIYGAV